LKIEGSEKSILYAKNLHISIEKINNLVKELLDISKLQHGKMILNIKEFNFESLINETIEFTRQSSPESAITVTGNANIMIHADYERLQQVVVNLLSNAVKYSPASNKIGINISTENDELLFAVKDHGVGINKDNLLTIFEKFYREENNSISFPGLGVGLFISAEIIRRHKGRIWAKSTLGKGSQFNFAIPLN
jgi:signal transduction histidine kinase